MLLPAHAPTPSQLLRAWSVPLIWLGCLGPVLAQTSPTLPTVPDAGSLAPADSNRRPVVPPQRPGLQAPAAASALQLPRGQTVRVQRLQVLGLSLISEAALRPVLAAYEGRELDLAALQDATAAVVRAYTEAGWLARAYLPAQDVTDGVVRIQVVEARLGEVQVTGSSKRYDRQRAVAQILREQPLGEPIQLERLQRGVLLLGDTPGLRSQAALRAGSRDGLSDVVLELEDSPLLVGNLSLANAGSRATGRAQVAVDGALNNPSGRGDRLALSLGHSDGVDQWQASWQLPVAALRLGLSASGMRYALVGAQFAALQAHGDADSLGLAMEQPLLRSPLRNLSLRISAEQRRYHNEANLAVRSDYRNRVLALALSGNQVHGDGQQSSTAASLKLDIGQLDLDGSPHQADDAAGARTAGRYHKLRYSLVHSRALSGTQTVQAVLNGQLADRNLDSSERFSLGGPQGVRAYPVSEGSASEAQLLNLEWQAVLPAPGWRGKAFYDIGHGRSHVRALSTPVAGERPRYTLQGLGVQLAWTGPAGLDLSLTAARTVGPQPLLNSLGKHQDGSQGRSRMWLQASLPFSL